MLSQKDQLFADAFYKKLLTEPEPLEIDMSLIGSFVIWGNEVIKNNYENRGPVLKISNDLKKKLLYILTQKKDSKETVNDCMDAIWGLRLFEAQNRQLDSYLLYLERHREPKDKFYQPKRKQFWKIGIVQSLQAMLDDRLDLLCISMPPGTGKTSIGRFFLTGVIGWFPDEYNLFFSHSDGITRKYYDDALRIVTDNMEYAWSEVFPKLKVNHQNAKAQEFNVGKEKMFNSLQCSTRGSNNAGQVRASKFLVVDDMIAKIEEALNKATLDKLWDVYTTDARQRKTVDVNKKPCKEIIIATRWSTMDIIGRLQNIYGDDKRARFIAVSDIDPKTGLSNFDYDFQGFTAEFYHDIEMTMDDISYRCLYKNAPVEREGLLYHEDELRRFLTLPSDEPDAIIGVCDTKSKGIDYMVLPVMLKYGDDYYCTSVICDDNSDFGVQKQRLTDIIVENNMQQVEFESNAGGDRLAADVAEMVKAEGGRCNITTKATETNKETRIIVNSDWVKKHVLFRDKSQYAKKSDYGRFMEFITTYSVVGRNRHDDCVDCLANFALFVTRSLYRRRTRIMRSPI